MSLLIVDSFDHYASADINEKHLRGTNVTITSGGRNSSNCATIATGGNTYLPVSSSPATIVIGFAMKATAAPGSEKVFLDIRDGTGDHIAVDALSDGSLRVSRNGSSSSSDRAGASTLGGLTVIAGPTAAGTVNYGGVYQYIEFKCTIHDSTGAVEIKIDGASVLTGTSLDTKLSGTSTITNIGIGNGTSANMLIDDLYICDSAGSVNNTFLGDCRVECILPSDGNGTNTGLTTSTGADHGALVNETTPNDDTDYNHGTTAGVKDTYNYPALSSTGAVKGIQICISAKKTDTGTKQIAPVYRPVATDYDGTTQNIGATTYNYYLEVKEQNPETAAAWTIAEINASEYGCKVVA